MNVIFEFCNLVMISLNHVFFNALLILSASDVEILTKRILQVYYFIVLFISYSKLRSKQMKMHPFQR